MTPTRLTIPDPAFKSLYRIGGAAALIAGLFFRRNLDAEYMLFKSLGIITGGPASAPGTVPEWLRLLQTHPWIGLTLLNFFDLVDYALAGMIFLALVAALWRSSPSWMLVAAALGFAGVTVYFASNQAVNMLALSSQYALATTDDLRSMLLAAGQAALAVHHGNNYSGGGLYVSFLLVTLAGLIFAIAMLRGAIFNRLTALMGILANVFGLGYYVALVLAPALVALPVGISAVFLLIWYILTGLRLWALGSARSTASLNLEQTSINQHNGVQS